MGRGAILAAVAVIVLVGTLVLLPEDRWDIIYELDGGTLPDGAPAWYSEEERPELPTPERDGYVFTGWYLDGELTQRIDSIPEGSEGDITIHAGWIPAVEHSITYVLDGGSLTDGYPSTFIGGILTTLPIPVREGHIFAGWFEDPDCTVPVVVVGDDDFEDVTVYACWEDSDVSGNGFVWDVDGVYHNGTAEHRMSGTLTSETLTVRDGSAYVETLYDITYEWDGGSTHDGHLETGWVDGQSGYSYVGVETVGGYPCTVWTDGEGTTIWLYHLWVQVKVVQGSGADSIVQTLSDWYLFVPETSFVPQVRAEWPLTVDGVEEAEIGDAVVLVANGDGFEGWYADGELVTTERTLEIPRADPGTVYSASAGGGFTVVDSSAVLGDFGFGQDATVTDDTGSQVTEDLGSLAPGCYTVQGTYDGYVRYLDIFIDATGSFSATWTYEGEEYSLSLDILYSDVYRYDYCHDYLGGFRGSLDDPEYILSYHTSDDPYIEGIVDSLSEMGRGLDPTEFAQFVLCFVQSIPYVTDSEAFGTEDYWLYPLETLWYGGGDCEDTAILYDTIMAAAGYDVAFILFSDHAMSAVVTDALGFAVTVDGREYDLCETTEPGFMIGNTSSGHLPGDVYGTCVVSVGTS